jgi:hypothetical protein
VLSSQACAGSPLVAAGCPVRLLRLLEGQEGLEVLDLEGAGAPPDSSSWGRLRHLANIQELNLNYVMQRRTPYV